MHEKRCALITGSSRSIGLKIAEKLAEDKFSVILNCNIKVRELEEAAKWMLTKTETKYFVADVSNYESSKELIEFVLEEMGRIDVLVNNAGITRDKIFHKMLPEDWLEVINTNLNGTINCTHHVVPIMKEQRYGRIINISSVIGQIGNIGQTNYAASKAGVIGFTKSLAKELAKDNITVNTVCPGFINTDMIKTIPESIREKLISLIPLNRFGLSSEVANLVKFIASEYSSYITGQVFNVNGGLYM